MGKKPNVKQKGKKKRGNHAPSEKWKKYTVEESKVVRASDCPKCGKGIFLAVHKDRLYCGKCHYVEWTSKKA